MERGNKKVLKEHSLPLGSATLGECYQKKKKINKRAKITVQRYRRTQGPQGIGFLRRDTLQTKTKHTKSRERDLGSPVETATPVSQ